MDNIQTLANSLRVIASGVASTDEKTQIEKIATIAILHEALKSKKQSTNKYAGLGQKALAALGAAGIVGGAGYAGYRSGSKRGKTEAVLRSYIRTAPYVRRSRNRANAASMYARRLYMANRANAVKKASLASTALGAAAVAVPVGAYALGSKKGRSSARRKWTETVRRKAVQRIKANNNRYRLAVNYIRGARQAARSSR